MPKKPEPSFEVKKIIWDVVTKVGKDNLQAIQRQVDYEIDKRRRDESQEVQILEDTPETRTIKRIIDEDLNKLNQDIVIAELPTNVWKLRKDYEEIKRLSDSGNHTFKSKDSEREPSLTSEKTNRAFEHDSKLFVDSDEIMNENRLDILLNRLLVGNRFYLNEVAMLFKYCKYFEKESNKYVISNLRCKCDRSCKMIERLRYFIEVHSYYLEVNDDELGMKYKLIPGGDYDRFYKHLTNDYTQSRVVRIFNEKTDRLVLECSDAYKKYRSTVRETLYL